MRSNSELGSGKRSQALVLLFGGTARGVSADATTGHFLQER
ncbi:MULTISPECIES: hypothetical protein [Kamptonema]|nr:MULTISPECIES: hypothetical protein [Kamptonema]